MFELKTRPMWSDFLNFRENLLFVAATFALALQAHAPSAHAAEVVEVLIDQAKIIQLPDSTLTVVVGNPLILDVALLRTSGKVVLTGKGFGETNLIAVDRNGGVVSESTVRVKEPRGNVIVQRGVDRETYNCRPRCQPTVALGDAPRYMTETVNQISARNAAETASASRPR